ncbi:MAG: DNA mismatch repair protein MutS [Alphaproteobacteria bacterium]
MNPRSATASSDDSGKNAGTGPAPEPKPAAPTPMMAQYIEIKAANPDSLLFYRMGDFYELFFDDAGTASRALGITLTKRGKHLGADIPMCGVPVHAANDYLQKLIAAGFRVAVCEQTEDPAAARKRGAKAVVRREVTRLVTPGTITEDRLLDEGRNNFLAAYCAIGNRASDGGTGEQSPGTYREAIAWIDISTGEFRTGPVPAGGLGTVLAQIDPREILVPERLWADEAVRSAFADCNGAETPLAGSFFDSVTASDRLCSQFGVATMDSFGAFSRAELAAAAAIVSYVEKTQIAARPPISPPKRDQANQVLAIDPATRGNLELFQTLSGSRAGSLVATIDKTVTSAGRRLLARQIAAPLCDPAPVNARLDAVAHFHDNASQREKVRGSLKSAPDMMRAMSRLALGRGSPRDLGAVRDGLAAGRELAHRFRGQPADDAARLPELLGMATAALQGLPGPLEERLTAALSDTLPAMRGDGGFVQRGYRDDLDEACNLRDESRKVVAELQATYARKTGIKSLKIRHNNVLGYFVDVTAIHAETLRAGDDEKFFIHRQTLANAVRFTTTELAELEQKIAGAADRALRIEFAVFDELCADIAAATAQIRAGAEALAVLDVATSHAEMAMQNAYVRPMIDGSMALDIVAGRHPVVEAALKQTAQAFVANDCALGPGGRPSAGESEDETGADAAITTKKTLPDQYGRIWLVTGPNMAGKSTFLRQAALIVVLAQSGSFVPAASAHIGIVDALCSRVGAADDLARGRSTFMVEMVETAAILNQASNRALVILDEIGRGTATFDGLSIAWATIEHLHDVNRCRALFATHYHELIALAARLDRLDLATVQVKEWDGDVVFLHRVVAGAADRSYGIQVARLAGLPDAVIARARDVLEKLEDGDRNRGPQDIAKDLPLFSATVHYKKPDLPSVDPVLEALDALDPDALSPRQALDALYTLKTARKQKS